jgi:hypothetical protein
MHFSSLEIIGCNVHSILDVIKSAYCVKDCEDNPPIVITDPRDELTVFEKTENFAPGSLSAKSSGVISLLAKISLLASFFSSVFSKKHILHKNIISSSNPMHIIPSDHLKSIL